MDYIKRKIKHILFFIKNGYSIRELWSLDYTLAEYILPRLIQFKENNNMSYPCAFKDSEEWHKVIDEMIWSFDFIVNDRDLECKGGKDIIKSYKKVQKGLNLFGKHFMHLWD